MFGEVQMGWPEIAFKVRITGGVWRGRRLNPMKGFQGRPTTDFGREGLFNLLRTRVDLEGAQVLDLFSGTGMVGMECASRGAAFVTSVEKQNKACRYIKEQYKNLDYDNILVVCNDSFGFMRRAYTPYDFVFADPPYNMDKFESIPGLVKDSGLVAQGGLFVLEHGERIAFGGEDGFVECRKFGHVHFSFFTFES